MGTINEYDETKALLNIIREGKIHEGNDVENEDNEEVTDDELNNEEIENNSNNIIDVNQEDLTSFKELFSPLTHSVVVRDLIIYKDSQNTIGTGKLNGVGELSWVFDLNKGLTITTIDFRLDNGDMVSDIHKLKGIFTNWQKDWSSKIQLEYLNQLG